MTLNPQEEYVISRQLNDPSDVGTNYVQAVIRNAKTDAIIATVNLNDKGSQRFTKTWQVVSDPTGLGLYITITTTVYTDSGYTVKSTVYGIEQHELLVQDRINPYLRGGGADVDYKRIKKMIDEAVSSIPKPTEPKEPDLIPISEGLQAVITEIRNVDIPKPEKTDLGPVLKQLEALQTTIKAIHIPETDLKPVMNKLDNCMTMIEPYVDGMEAETEALFERIKDFFDGDIEAVKKAVSDLSGKFDDIPYIVLDKQAKKEDPKTSVLDEYLKL